MRLIVVRHYKTINNASRRILGWTDSPPTPSWESDLASLDVLLRRHVLRFDAAYSSALSRARTTAQWLAQRRPGLRVRESASLNEVDYGELAQLPKSWAAACCPAYKTDAGYVFPNGESFQAMRDRSTRYLLDLEREHAGQTVLVVTHAGVIRALATHFLGLPFTPHLKRKISHRYVGDFSIESGGCVRYDELGEPSGFVQDTVIEVPWRPFEHDDAAAVVMGPPPRGPVGRERREDA